MQGWDAVGIRGVLAGWLSNRRLLTMLPMRLATPVAAVMVIIMAVNRMSDRRRLAVAS